LALYLVDFAPGSKVKLLHLNSEVGLHFPSGEISCDTLIHLPTCNTSLSSPSSGIYPPHIHVLGSAHKSWKIIAISSDEAAPHFFRSLPEGRSGGGGGFSLYVIWQLLFLPAATSMDGGAADFFMAKPLGNVQQRKSSLPRDWHEN
jgi:hypothetical protein